MNNTEKIVAYPFFGIIMAGAFARLFHMPRLLSFDLKALTLYLGLLVFFVIFGSIIEEKFNILSTR